MKTQIFFLRSVRILGLWVFLLVLTPWPSAAEQSVLSEAGPSLESGRTSLKKRVTDKERRLLRRPDEKRPEERLTVDLWGRPLTIGGVYEIRSFGTGDLLFKDRRVDDEIVLMQNLAPEVFYQLSDDVSIFLKGGVSHREVWKSMDIRPPVDGAECWDVNTNGLCDTESLGTLDRKEFDEDLDGDGACTLADCEEDEHRQEVGVRRDEMWLYDAYVMGTPLSLQIGRQRVVDRREWWWDDYLDAIRFQYDPNNKLNLEVGLAQLLGRVSTNEDHIDPEEEDVLRLMGRGTWEWTRKNRLEVFFLRQWDRSGLERFYTEGKSRVEENAVIVEPSREDTTDANLTWLGLSARGRWKLGRPGKLYYWSDTAIVRGRETVLDFGGEETERKVSGVPSRHEVTGWAFDLGATWQTTLRGRPSFALGYAVGSGDDEGKDLSQPRFNKSDIQRIHDRSFRQTGIQDNNARFRGVNRFKYYGELLEPELSNLRIATAAVGFRFLKHSSIEILYHFYRQVDAAKFLRDAGIRRQPAGRKREIGHEIDLAIGLEEWEHLEIELIASAFRAGPAFGAHCDDDDEDVPTEPIGPQDCPREKDFVPESEGHWSYLGFLKIKLNY